MNSIFKPRIRIPVAEALLEHHGGEHHKAIDGDEQMEFKLLDEHLAKVQLNGLVFKPL